MAGIFEQARDVVARFVSPSTIRATTRDGIQNVAARLGVGQDNLSSNSLYGFSVVSKNRQNLDNAYRGSWLVGVAVDAVAEDMTRAGIEFTGDLDPGNGEELQAAFSELRLWHQLCNAIRWARLYGGALAVMLIDGQDVSTPLLPDRVRRDQFKGLLVLDRWMVNPSLTELVQDFGPDFGMPLYYTVNVNPQQGYAGNPPTAAGGGTSEPNGSYTAQRIHHSRVIRFDGAPLPFFSRQQEMGWGQSVIERLYDRLIAYDSASQGAAQLVFKAHLRTLKVKGLRTTMATGGKSLDGLVSSIAFMRRYQSNEGVTLLDADDEFATHTYAFTGLPELLSQFSEQISGALQIPLVRLFGQSPAGFSTGETDLANYDDMINASQESDLRPGLTRLLPVLARSRLGRPLPDGVSYKFVPLRQMDPAQKADIATKVAQAVGSAEGSGIISRKVALEELKQSSATTGIFTNISDEDITEAEMDPPPGSEMDGGPGDPPGGGDEIDEIAAAEADKALQSQ